MRWSSFFLVFLLGACSQQEPFDVVLSGGTVYSGADEAPTVTDVGITGDRIVTIGDLGGHPADIGIRDK